MWNELFKKEVVEWSLFEHDANITLQKLIFERYQKIASISIMDSALYPDFIKMTYEAYSHLLPYLKYEIRPEVRRIDWMVHDEDWKLIRARTPEEIAQIVVEKYISSYLNNHLTRLELIRTQKEANNKTERILSVDVLPTR